MKPSMMPAIEWLTIPQVLEYMDISRTTFWEIRKEHKLSVSRFKGKNRFSVKEINKLLESSVTIKQVA